MLSRSRMYPREARDYVITTSPPCHHLRCDVIISNVIIFAEMLSPLYTAQLESGIHRKCKCQLAKILLSTDSSCCNSSTISSCHHHHHSGNDVDPEKPMMLNLIMARRPLTQINPPMSRDLSGGGRGHGCDVRSRGPSAARGNILHRVGLEVAGRRLDCNFLISLLFYFVCFIILSSSISLP